MQRCKDDKKNKKKLISLLRTIGEGERGNGYKRQRKKYNKKKARKKGIKKRGVGREGKYGAGIVGCLMYVQELFNVF